METEKLQLNDLTKTYTTRSISLGCASRHEALFKIYDKDVSRFLKDVDNSDCEIDHVATIFKRNTFYFKIYQDFKN